MMHEAALEAELARLLDHQPGRLRSAADEQHVGLGRQHAAHAAVEVGGAVVGHRVLRHDFAAGLLPRGLEHRRPRLGVVMIGIGDRQVLAVLGHRILDERLDVVGELRRNAQGQLVAARRDLGHAGVREHQVLLRFVVGLHREAAARMRAQDRRRLVLLHQALRIDRGFARVVLVVERDDFELVLSCPRPRSPAALISLAAICMPSSTFLPYSAAPPDSGPE